MERRPVEVVHKEEIDHPETIPRKSVEELLKEK